MNGRLYDPELGRMLSPDPYVQVPEYSQNFNRYSYVLNNPLNLTDPTGFSWFGKAMGWLKTNWRTVVVIVVAAILVCTGIGAAIAGGLYAAVGAGTLAATSVAGYALTGAVIGAITGGLSAGLNGGNLGDVLRGAVIGGISGALTGSLHVTSGVVNVAGHGIVGGASNVAMGGKFGDGFLSAAAAAGAAQTGFVSPEAGTFGGDELNFVSRTAIASVVGGTASALGGGKFSNGAVTGAMSHLLNAEAAKALKVGAYANGNEHDPEDTNSFRDRSIQSAGKNVFGFSSLDDLVAGLSEYKGITSLVIHGHGRPDVLLTGDATTRINGDGYANLAGKIISGSINIANNARITIFACNQDTQITALSAINSNLKYFASVLAANGRGDIRVTGANGHVSPNKSERYGHVFDGGGKFNTYQHNKLQGSVGKINYAR
jgi:hypothetical protein